MIKQLALFLTCTFAATTAALADDILTWGEAQGWAILVDPAVGNGCFMEKHFEDGTLVHIGAVPNRKGGFFAAYNPEWVDIEDGATGTVKFDFPDVRFSGEVVGVAKDGLFGGYAFFDNPNVPMEFAARRKMTIFGESGRVVELELTGTMKAIEAVKACQAEQPD